MLRLKNFLIALPLLAITAGAAPLTFYAILDGPSEPTPSLGTGIAYAVIDDVGHTLIVSATFSGLTGLTTAAHIHGPTAVAGSGTASVATQTPSFIGFPLGVTSGSFGPTTYDTTLASTYRAGFITANGGTTAGAEAALFAAIVDGKAYFNIHSDQYAGGEIRGFFQPVPEPSTLAVVGVVLAGLGFRRARRLIVQN